MNRITKYDLEPGPYIDEQGFEIVVLDVITHSWNDGANLQECLLQPLVLGRQLLGSEERYLWPMEVFKMKFKKI